MTNQRLMTNQASLHAVWFASNAKWSNSSVGSRIVWIDMALANIYHHSFGTSSDSLWSQTSGLRVMSSSPNAIEDSPWANSR
ncbi:hypothetical protein TNCV_4421221 [Trichonephila clavipes]|nr:hypothetical protein TNCV_4421221 [Trichonephila clavipes]